MRLTYLPWDSSGEKNEVMHLRPLQASSVGRSALACKPYWTAVWLMLDSTLLYNYIFINTHKRGKRCNSTNGKWTVGCVCNSEVKLRPKGHQNFNLFPSLCGQLRWSLPYAHSRICGIKKKIKKNPIVATNIVTLVKSIDSSKLAKIRATNLGGHGITSM